MAGVLGCGGGAGSKYNVKLVSKPDSKWISFAVQVVPLGDKDALDSAIIASVGGAGCTITKTRAPLDKDVDAAEGKCGEVPITLGVLKASNILSIQCPAEVGAEVCKSKFGAILSAAADARYIQ